MERLSKLLNEYLESKEKDIQQFMNIAALMTQSDSKLYQTYIISKDFGFIKRLIENNKIDYESVRKGENSGSRWDFETIQPEYFMIMLLSVQDNPIEFLISLLK